MNFYDVINEIVKISTFMVIHFISGVNDWMETLDKRYQAKQRADGAVFPKKERINGSNSKSVPPLDAPEWALNKEWIQLQSADSGQGKHGVLHAPVLHTCLCLGSSESNQSIVEDDAQLEFLP